jgi:16S rRNA (uracil1498-N3)-methyltransferase
MPDRFYAPVSLNEPLIELSREESQHLAAVLRKSPGERVVVFDGRGAAAEAIVETVGKRVSTLRVASPLTFADPPTPQIDLATAAPKGDRARWLIEKATELGADRWTPLELAHSVVDPGPGKLERLRQTVIAACKQCGRDRLLEIAPVQHWSAWLADAARRGPVLVAHPSGVPVSTALRELVSARPLESQIALAIGPEGGFTDGEIEQAMGAGAVIVSLGTHILRIETAAVAALAALRLTLPL